MAQKLGAEVILGTRMNNMMPRGSLWISIMQLDDHEMVIVSNRMSKLAGLLRDLANDLDAGLTEVQIHNMGGRE